MNSADRLARLRKRLEGEDIPALLVCDPVNVAYMTGFEGVFDGEDAHALVITSDQAWLYTDRRYSEAAERAATGTEWAIRVPERDPYVSMCADMAAAEIVTMALESSMPHGRFRFISREFAGNVEAVDQWIEDLRQTKDADEISRIEAAQALTDTAFAHIVTFVRPGMTEWEVALELEMYMRREGSEGVAFPPIVASGPNSARPHAKVTHRAFEPGDFVKMDFGARIDGYCADMTRTVVIGSASERQREMYETVLEANLAAIAAVRSGLAGSAIDAVARDVITAHGFGDKFTHGLGHGVGMRVHELPSVSARSKKSITTGSVITIEPGIYEPGFGGVRIEDLVVVEEGHARVLTTSPKELMEL